MRQASAALLVALLLAGAVSAQGLEWVKANYTKYEYYIPMRDGVRLFTSVYIPKDRTQSYPILLNRTPYGVAPYGADRYRENIGPSPLFAKEGYIFVYQDVRGRWMSEGEFVHMRPHNPHKRQKEIDESTDTYDTIAWLLDHIPNHNGHAGQWGISYPGFYTVAGMIDAHPALKAVSPQAPVADWFARDDWHHNGAFLLNHAFGFFNFFGGERARPSSTPRQPYISPQNAIQDGYEFLLRLGTLHNIDEKVFKGEISFWNDMMKHDRKDEFWTARNILPHVKNVQPAVMTVGGWYDAENLYGTLQVYRSVEANGPGAFNLLVMGPWIHGGWAGTDGDKLGDVRFDAKTAEFYRENIELAFFNYFLKDKGKLDLPKAYVFETGANQWRKLDAWPPKRTVSKSLYLHASGKLSLDPPTTDDTNAYDEYVSDPAKPVPYIPGFSWGMATRYMADDQRFASRRPDVLVYQTAPLEEDFTIAGPLQATLYVSTTGTDSDWVVKLNDVYPDQFPDEKGQLNNSLGGYQQLVRGDALRGKFRNSLERPEPFVPGQPTKMEFTLDDVFHTFRRGHRIMVQVQSSCYPLFDRNPQKFMNIGDATEEDFQKATERVYHSLGTPSSLHVLTVPREAPPAR
jgi:putative CocE/NonD family hydrolase